METNTRISNEPLPASTSLRPVLLLQLQGETNINTILTDLTLKIKSNIRIIEAQLDYVGNVNFGIIHLHLLDDELQNQKAINYFTNQQIKHSVSRYAWKGSLSEKYDLSFPPSPPTFQQITGQVTDRRA